MVCDGPHPQGSCPQRPPPKAAPARGAGVDSQTIYIRIWPCAFFRPYMHENRREAVGRRRSRRSREASACSPSPDVVDTGDLRGGGIAAVPPQCDGEICLRRTLPLRRALVAGLTCERRRAGGVQPCGLTQRAAPSAWSWRRSTRSGRGQSSGPPGPGHVRRRRWGGVARGRRSTSSVVVVGRRRSLDTHVGWSVSNVFAGSRPLRQR